MHTEYKPPRLIADDLSEQAGQAFELQQLHQRFMEHQGSSPSGTGGRLTEESADRYTRLFGTLANFLLRDRMSIGEITAEWLRKTLSERYSRHGDLSARKTPVSERYAWRFLRLVDELCGFVAQEQGLPKNAAAAQLIASDFEYANARANDATPDVLSLAEYGKLRQYFCKFWDPFDHPNPQIEDWRKARNVACFSLMLGAGLAPREALALLHSDLFFDAEGAPLGARVPAPPMNTRNRHKRPRDVAFDAWLAEILKHWLSLRRTLARSKDLSDSQIRESVLFPGSVKGWAPLSNSMLNRAFDDLMERIIKSSAPRSTVVSEGNSTDSHARVRGPFTLRHTFIVKSRLEREVDVNQNGKRRFTDDEIMKMVGIDDKKSWAKYCKSETL